MAGRYVTEPPRHRVFKRDIWVNVYMNSKGQAYYGDAFRSRERAQGTPSIKRKAYRIRVIPKRLDELAKPLA